MEEKWTAKQVVNDILDYIQFVYSIEISEIPYLNIHHQFKLHQQNEIKGF